MIAWVKPTTLHKWRKHASDILITSCISFILQNISLSFIAGTNKESINQIFWKLWYHIIGKQTVTFTATSLPSFVIALWTWAKLAAAIGSGLKSENISDGLRPKSSRNSCSTYWIKTMLYHFKVSEKETAI